MALITQIVGDGRPGGGTTAVLTLSRLLAKRGHELEVVSQPDSYLLREAERLGMRTQGIDFTSRRHSLRAARALSSMLNGSGTVIAHAHGARAALPLAVARRMRWLDRRLRFAYTVHGFHYPAKPVGLQALAREAERFCISQADWTNFVSSADCLRAQRDGLLSAARSHATVRNAVSLDCPDLPALKRFDIGFVGRLAPQKNPLLLAGILAAMRPARPSMAVVGGGELAGAVRASIEKAGLTAQVAMKGECDRRQALAAMAQCRVLVLPSLWEGHPITLIEAMTLGIPVVASDIPGNDEIVVPGSTGYLVPARDARAYATCIQGLLQDSDLRQRMGSLARATAAREFSTERMLDAHLRGYRLEG